MCLRQVTEWGRVIKPFRETVFLFFMMQSLEQRRVDHNVYVSLLTQSCIIHYGCPFMVILFIFVLFIAHRSSERGSFYEREIYVSYKNRYRRRYRKYSDHYFASQTVRDVGRVKTRINCSCGYPSILHTTLVSPSHRRAFPSLLFCALMFDAGTKMFHHL